MTSLSNAPHWLGVCAAAALGIQSGACVDVRSDEFVCESSSDCESPRSCVSNWCVLEGDATIGDGGAAIGTGNCPGCISLATDTFAPGGTINARWQMIPEPSVEDWICYYEQGQKTDSLGPSGWGTLETGCGYTDDTSGSGSFSFPAPSEPGTYELRLFFDDEWGPDGARGNTGESNLSFLVQ